MAPSLSLNPSWPHYAGIVVTILSVILGAGRYLLDWQDPYRCDALLQRGSWLDSSFKNWQPDGCMMHQYKPADAATCFASRDVLFIGDSITRNLFFAFAHLLDPSIPATTPTTGEKHADYTARTPSGMELSFRWDPYLNSSATTDAVRARTRGAPRPALLALGSGLWYLRYADSTGGLPAWEANTEALLAELATPGRSAADAVVILPVEEVVPDKLSPERGATMRLADIDAMNSDLYHRIVPVGSYALPPTARGPAPIALPLVFNRLLDNAATEDGLHFGPDMVRTQAQILLNMRCNDVLDKTFPIDKTCCRSYPTPSFLQLLFIVSLVAWGPFKLWGAFRGGHLSLPIVLRSEDIPPLVISISTLLIFLADRTHFYLKEQKQYEPWSFAFLNLLTLGVGLATVKRGDKDMGFLNRDQTDEWKGWMQIAILIYHYTGASKISGIYNPIRVLVASYLFMTGYGHATFYIKKADFGFLRIAQVLVRINLFTCILAYIMNTNYIVYYFSPLVSFWFLIIYATMAIGARYNDRAPLLAGKFVTSAAIVTVVMKAGWPMQSLFDLLEMLCNIHWSAKEWSFRVTLDLWIVYAGMFAALAFIKIKDHRLTEHPYWPHAHRAAVSLGGMVLVWFFVFELGQESKFTYNAWHPYVSWAPVLGFVALRNASSVLRSSTSRAFAFIGRCSLETFVIQYHYWLAADTKGILRVVGWRPANFVLTSAAFIYLSWVVADATGILTAWICGGAKGKGGLPAPGGRQQQQAQQAQGQEAIPLVQQNGSSAEEPKEGEQPRRALDRLAESTAQSASQRGFRVWEGDDGWKPGLKAKLGVWLGAMWLANVLWEYV
ncbi:Cas1p-domain-containing protein [Schizophyllum commune H4-8]|uniref:Cas1p-domain-containing protein n=1 Tax=Schizophyllum commune (strain H4-8 / FGSC 9210) TaxID=578458 RepID=UPI00215FE61E|nr:Cas1p-domain-containing protein [Schizophyllum commune H4-8]KAI5898472.1 Cas1p-domain-containing protein [Schizophyllum commune H4-8]